MAELLDTVGRREVDGGRGYSGEVAAAASAMVEEGEGEAMGRKGVSRGSRARRGGRPAHPRARAASRWRRGELTLAGVTSLPALARAGS